MTDDGREAWIDRGPDDTPFVSRDRPPDAFDVIVRDEPRGSLPPDGVLVRSDQVLTAPVIDHVRTDERLTVFVSATPTKAGTWYGVRTRARSDRLGVGSKRPLVTARRCHSDYPGAVSMGAGSVPTTEAPIGQYNEPPNFEQSAQTASKSAELPSFQGESFSIGTGDGLNNVSSIESGSSTPNEGVESDYRFQLEVTDWPDKVMPAEKVELHLALKNLTAYAG